MYGVSIHFRLQILNKQNLFCVIVNTIDLKCICESYRS